MRNRDRDRGADRPAEAGTAKTRSGGAFPVVGIGASAGGIRAFQTFLDNTPADSGMAFVLIQHLHPEHESHLAEVLRPHTRLSVVQAADGMAITPDAVYVIPPDADLTIRDGALRVTKPGQPRGRRTPIDAFFLSLAEKRGEDAIGVVLSGAGHDGTLGLRAIKEQGGLVLAQALDPDDRSTMAGMPQSAIETGLVDDVLPVERMPARLVAYVRHRARITAGDARASARPDTTVDYLPRICTLLHTATGHDLRQYKAGTLVRRINRRMQVLQIAEPAKYLERLRNEPGEVDRLFQDLLIGVTHFFRDPEAFAALAEEVIPGILARKEGPDAQVRVWVPGCATGEEAYSVAILLREAMDRAGSRPGVQVFATDIDAAALRVARTGKYPPSVAADLRPDRLHRFFVSDGRGYRVVKEIRGLCVFSEHNVIRDPPFSRLDLISCRNLLIYMNAELQRRLIPVFHYALETDGCLFLGSSESAAQHGDLFATVDKRHHIFRNREKRARPALQFPLAARGQRRTSPPVPPRGPDGAGRDDAEAAARVVLDEFAPAYVIVDGSGDVVRFSSERTGRYLTPPPGAPTTSVVDMARRGLRLDLRVALHKAIQTKETVVRDNVRVAGQSLPSGADPRDGVRAVRLIVRPLIRGDGANGRYLVLFQDLGPVQTGAAAEGAGGEVENAHVEHLEDELRATREHLQSAIEELETTNEELQSSNEDLLSANEELQSANEELETSKEELESSNEELHTVNAELHHRFDELAAANNDLKNLIESTRIALIFLDPALRVKSFTPAIAEIFHLIDADLGRPFTHVAHRLDHPDLGADVREVLATHRDVEREVGVPETGAGYLMRVVPYRTVDNVVEGAVLTLIDITERKRAEEQRARLAAIVAASDDAIIGTTPDGTITAWNAGAERIYGYRAEEALGRPISLLTPEDRDGDDARILDAVRAGQGGSQLDTVRVNKSGRPIHVSLTVSPVKDGHGNVVAVSTIARDVTERARAEELRRAEEQQRLLVAEVNHRLKNMLGTVQAIAVLTLGHSASLQEFGESFVERLQSLANAHGLLARTDPEGVGLRDLVCEGLAAYRGRDGNNVTVIGEDLVLKPTTALPLAMTLHELATNASKYGALSTSTGRVEVRWRADDRGDDGQPWLSLQWTESGGPAVKEPARRGFGLRFIERSVAYELHGTTDMTFAPAGLSCTIGVPLADAAREPRG